jgi:CRP-like cAMP-binding protein
MSGAEVKIAKLDVEAHKAALLDNISVFKGISDDTRMQLCEALEPQIIPRFQFIYHQGDISKYVYLLAQGAVKIGTFHSDGREIIKQVLHPEAIFGELGAICQEKHHNYALTFSSEVILYRVKTEEFQKLMLTSPELHFNILSMISRRLKYTEKRLESLIFKDARQRIVDFLRYHAELHGRQVGFETFFKHDFTQQDIANFTGTSRQTVTSVLNALRKSNKIYFNRRGVLIRDLAALS